MFILRVMSTGPAGVPSTHASVEYASGERTGRLNKHTLETEIKNSIYIYI